MSATVDVAFVTRNKLLQVPDRVVKPRVREYEKRPVMAIFGEDTLTENGEIGTVTELLYNLPKMAPTLFVAIGSADLLARMDAIYAQFSHTWQFRVSNHERDITTPDGVRVATRVTLAIHYMGWKGKNFHKLIDPTTMYGHRLDRIWPGEGTIIGRLLEWGVALRDFCDTNGVEVRPTAGAISGQFLTDPRFYPDARRKVPGIINESTREYMPGNNYQLHAHTDQREYTAIYLDQSRAHHYHARTTPLPDSNLLYAHGRFQNLSEISFTEVPQNFHGLYCLDLTRPQTESIFSWLLGHPMDKVFVWSNELTHLIDMGYTVRGVRACWGSRKSDTGIPKYAAWCDTQLDSYSDAPWIKPLLLSAYGMLAMRSRYAETVFKLAKSGAPVKIRTGRLSLEGVEVKSTQKINPRIANVLHRGMIEAATRSESVGLAQHLTALGHTVLSIYADAVIVQLDDDNPLPQLPEPWRSKGTLNHLQFINQQAFMSGEMTKLPGVSAELKKHALRAHPPKMIDVAAEMEADEEALE